MATKRRSKDSRTDEERARALLGRGVLQLLASLPHAGPPMAEAAWLVESLDKILDAGQMQFIEQTCCDLDRFRRQPINIPF